MSAVPVMVNDELREKVTKFDEDSRKALELLVKSQNFWREALKRNIDIPYGSTHSVPFYSTSCNLAQYKEYDPETKTTPLDADATQVQFARVVRWARENKWPVTKDYKDDEFKIIVEETPIGRVEFYSTRQVVCERVQVGTKHVEARDEPIYEYQCDKVAFLKVEV